MSLILCGAIGGWSVYSSSHWARGVNSGQVGSLTRLTCRQNNHTYSFQFIWPACVFTVGGNLSSQRRPMQTLGKIRAPGWWLNPGFSHCEATGHTIFKLRSHLSLPYIVSWQHCAKKQFFISLPPFCQLMLLHKGNYKKGKCNSRSPLVIKCFHLTIILLFRGHELACSSDPCESGLFMRNHRSPRNGSIVSRSFHCWGLS